MKNSTILIADDEPSSRETLAAFLLQEGYDLAFAVSGYELLINIDEIKPDVILLDVMMPGLDGFEVCRRLKTNKKWCHIPVVLITVLDSREDMARGLDAGADDFLSKPVSGLELQARVRSMLRIKTQFDELEVSLRMREDLSNMIVHDMTNPLTAVLGYSEILKMKITKSDELRDIDIILTEGMRLSSLVNDILMIAKMEADKLILNCSDIDINQLVLAAEKDLSIIAKLKHINLATELPAESQRVSIDANLFRRVLDNLILNSLKFSPAESTITVRVEYSNMEQGTCTRIKVLDEGPGISEEHRNSIFDKFKTVGLKREGVPQTGLGLAFCKMVTEAHGGRIFVDANEPVGSVFTVEI